MYEQLASYENHIRSHAYTTLLYCPQQPWFLPVRTIVRYMIIVPTCNYVYDSSSRTISCRNTHNNSNTHKNTHANKFCTCNTAIVGTATHMGKGSVAMKVAPGLALGAFTGAYFGGKLGLSIPEKELKYGFSATMVVLGLRTLL